MQSRYQVTLPMGTGEKGKALAELLESQAKRFNVTESELLRIALRTLASVKKSQAVIDETGQTQPRKD